MPKPLRSAQSTLANARATYYPMPDGSLMLARVQVFSVPRFRELSWEDINKSVDKGSTLQFDDEPAILETADSFSVVAERNPSDIARAVRRARRAAFDLIMCNPDLDAFATLTYSPDCVDDKSAYSDCYPTLKNWLSNGVQRRGLKYICVPELTKRGDVHFHAICNAPALQIEKARSAKTGRLLKHHGEQVYNLTNWKAGFSTAQIITQRNALDDPRLAVSKYIFKYMGKNLGAKIGGRYLLKGGEMVKPIYLYGDGVNDFSTGQDAECYVKDLGESGKYWEFDFLGRECRVSEIAVDSLGV